MSTSIDLKWRYAAYAAAAILAAGAYLWLGSDSYAPLGPIGKPHGEEELPALNSIEQDVEAQERRDLFAFGKLAGQTTDPVPVVPAIPPPPLAEEVLPPPDPFADLKVIGLVARPGQVSVLLQFGTELRTVSPGEQFGPGDALSVAAIQGRNVLIVDSVAKTSKTFVLSEE